MINIKLVVIGDSSVGKTSLRTKYISGRFANGYRATIGADFITKTIPHPLIEGESVMLQIWDTAGQERFSSLSSAFFRGADAVLLMFDVNNAESLLSLNKWWTEFRNNAPIAEEDTEGFCCIVVGNKMDLLQPGTRNAVTEAEANDFIAQLIPLAPSPLSSRGPSPEPPLSLSQVTIRPLNEPNVREELELRRSPSPGAMRSNSIAITATHYDSSSNFQSRSPNHRIPKSRSRSSSRFITGTMSTARTALTIYHTPSSSIFDDFQSARSSPDLELSSNSSFYARRSSDSSASATTITPSLFTRTLHQAPISAPTSTTPWDEPFHRLPDRGPKLFFTSAKTGEGVQDVFDYLANRVLAKWAYDESVEASRMHFRDPSATSGETIRLELKSGRGRQGKVWSSCC